MTFTELPPEASLSILVHGTSKVGKSTFAATCPAPRLILDAEGGTKFLPGSKIYWDPARSAPPEWDGSWETCVVTVRNYQDVVLAHQWLNSGQHPFASVVLDSISEIQQRCLDSIAGTGQMRQQDWGDLLRIVATQCRQFRDLTVHPTRPLRAVVLVAMSRELDGRWRPWIQGQLSVAMPYYFDVVGFLYTYRTEDGALSRALLISPDPKVESGERVQGRLGPIESDLNVEHMLHKVFNGAVPTTER